MMATRRSLQGQDYGYGRPITSTGIPESSRRYGSVKRIGVRTKLTAPSSTYPDVSRATAFDSSYYPTSSAPYATDMTSNYSTMPAVSTSSLIRPDSMYSASGYNPGPSSAIYGSAGPGFGSYPSSSSTWEPQGRVSPESYLDDFVASPSPTDYALESSSKSSGKAKSEGKGHSSQRRPSNRDEFDGPHQFLQRPPPEYIAKQERDLPHLPTNLVVHEQDSILTMVNDRLSQCAFDFVAKYQFPIPLANGELRPVERPQDREWTEWVYLLKRLATKRRIPARVLYNGQIKQFITILENSLEMRHAAKHQSRPLKDDRNILQLISAGIQVAKILRDAEAMTYLDRLYVRTEKQIQERSLSTRYRS